MKLLNIMLLGCVVALLMNAIFYGSELPNSSLKTELGGPSSIGLKVIAVRGIFFAMAIFGTVLWFSANDFTDLDLAEDS